MEELNRRREAQTIRLWRLFLARAQWNVCANEVRAQGWFEQLGVVSRTPCPAQKCQNQFGMCLQELSLISIYIWANSHCLQAMQTKRSVKRS